MPEGGPQARRIRDAPLLRDAVRLLHRNRAAAAAVLVAALAVSAFAAYQVLKRPGDVHNPEAIRHFKPQKPPKPPPRAKTVNWPMFGFDRARTRYLPARGVRPPFRKLWRFTDRPLLEFPPIFVNGRLYFVNNSGFAYALDAKTGKTIWKRRVGRLNASSPVYSKHRLYIVNLVPGHIVKLNAANGKLIWKRSLPGRAESSPLVIGRTVYFGCEDGNLYALSTISGNVRWATALGGPVKSAPAFYRGYLYVGDYGGYMNAVNAKTGRLKWQSGSLGPGFGGSGQFYSTPAVAFGRVYAGNNDDRVYSYDLANGALAWSYSTGGYAYSGPTVATTKHSPPTVYIGSFDGNVYALNAKTGSLRWSRSAGGQVIGSLSAVGEIVYAAEFTNKTTSGFMMRSGRRVFHYPKGTYTPVVSDGRRLYLTGYSSITALEPFKPKPKRAKAKAHGARARAQVRGAKARARARQAKPRTRRAKIRIRRARARAHRRHPGAAGAGGAHRERGSERGRNGGGP